MNKRNINGGFTYVELIVVLSIFAVLTSVVMFNYNDFQSKINIRTLSTQIALRVTEAQKEAVAGTIPLRSVSTSWKPSYGIYFNISGQSSDADSKDFVYFSDLNNDNKYTDLSCSSGTGECLEKVGITEGDYISALNVFYTDRTSVGLSDLTLTFTRPDSGATIFSSNPNPFPKTVSYAQITVSSPSGDISNIKVYPSGRIQIN